MNARLIDTHPLERERDRCRPCNRWPAPRGWRRRSAKYNPHRLRFASYAKEAPGTTLPAGVVNEGIGIVATLAPITRASKPEGRARHRRRGTGGILRHPLHFYQAVALQYGRGETVSTAVSEVRLVSRSKSCSA